MSEPDSSIRKRMRECRLALPAATAAAASAAINTTLSNMPAISRSSAIATYMPAFGEVDCTAFATRMRSRRKRTYVPVLRKNRLLFAPWDDSSDWAENRYGIPEPTCSPADLLTPRQLDIVVAPLVAFDESLNRLGMGGGYYDRTFAFRKRTAHKHRPVLIGAAYSFQRVEALQPQDWDVPLDVVVTEKECFGSC